MYILYVSAAYLQGIGNHKLLHPKQLAQGITVALNNPGVTAVKELICFDVFSQMRHHLKQ